MSSEATRLERRSFSLLNVLTVIAVAIIAIVFISEFHRLFTRSTRVMREDMQRQGPPILAGAADFGVLYTAGRMIREGNAAHLYDPKWIAPEILRTEGYSDPVAQAASNSNEPFLRYYNPPIWAIGILPMTYLDLKDAYRVMTVINLLALGAVCYLCAQILGWKPLVSVLFTLGVFAYDPTHATIRGGQVSILVALSSGVSFYYLSQAKPFLSGLSAVVTMGKPQFLLAHGLGVLRLDRKAAVWLALCAAIVSLPFLLVGIGGIKDYVEVLRLRTDEDVNQIEFARLVLSWPGFYFALFGHAINGYVLLLLQAVTVGLFLLVVATPP